MKEFSEPDVPEYAILSHRWGKDEISYKDFLKGRGKSSASWKKIVDFCGLAQGRGYHYGWIDTVCIDKRSSAELSEAINSMFRWYKKSAECYAHLADVTVSRNHVISQRFSPDEETSIRKSTWWTRGWTLQELIAPRNVVFFDRDWQELGTKFINNYPHVPCEQPSHFTWRITDITGIPSDVLMLETPLVEIDVATKMTWLSGRQVSRQEDYAYCALGLFGINMPLLYGEGPDAWRRLQEMIISTTHDESIFVWPNAREFGFADSGCGISPILSAIRQSFPRGTMPAKGLISGRRPLYSTTNQGLRWDLKSHTAVRCVMEQHGRPMLGRSVILLPLACFVNIEGSSSSSQAYIVLVELDCGHYERAMEDPSVTLAMFASNSFALGSAPTLEGALPDPMTIYVHMHWAYPSACRKAHDAADRQYNRSFMREAYRYFEQVLQGVPEPAPAPGKKRQYVEQERQYEVDEAERPRTKKRIAGPEKWQPASINTVQ